jgi:uncharacterized protein (DUF1778 family)
MPKPKPVGRPKLPKAHAKSSIIPVRFNADDRKKVETAAKAKGQKVSEWVRNTLLKAATE